MMSRNLARHGLVVGLLLQPVVIVGQVTPKPATESTSRAQRFLMGTSMSIEVYGRDAATRQAAIDAGFAAIQEIDRLMSNYRDDSELARVNRDAAREPVVVSEPLMSVLGAARLINRRSQGAFDITVGPLVKAWGFKDKRPHVPTPDELAALRPLVSGENVVLDPDARTVRFARPGVEIDLGGIAKGFAVEIVGGVLRAQRLEGYVDAGGNQYFVGHPPGKTDWRVGIQDPDRPGRLLGALDVGEGSASTSGGYNNFLVVDGKRYGHILDPRTLRPAEPATGAGAILSVTVVSPDATLADALSKPTFVLGREAGRALIESFPGTYAVIAYRQADGGVGIDVSPALATRFHRADAS